MKTFAETIIEGDFPDFNTYLKEGNTLEDLDEYGFRPLVQATISNNLPVVLALIDKKVDIDAKDYSGRTALHWAVYFNFIDIADALLNAGANPNTYTRGGLPVLVYPLLRDNFDLKHLLYQKGANIDFALDFVNAKAIGHLFELTGWADLYTPFNKFIEVDYEGFILEFTIDLLQLSLRKFMNHYATKAFRDAFSYVQMMTEGLFFAQTCLRLQLKEEWTKQDYFKLAELMHVTPLLILPAASRGHAMCFLKYQSLWVKIDRGENAKKEGSVNIYHMNHPERVDPRFIDDFLHKKQPREYFHHAINDYLGLRKIGALPLTSQIVGNCSWANIEALVPASFCILKYDYVGGFPTQAALNLYEGFKQWDEDRVIHEMIQRFYSASPERQMSIATQLGAVLFQSLDESKWHHVRRAEKILSILTLKPYQFIIKNYLDIYCLDRLTFKGNNFLKMLDSCGIDPNIGVSPIATRLKKRE